MHVELLLPAKSEIPLCVYVPFLQSNGSEMTTDVMAAFRERLAANTWLDDVTRKRCEEKVR